MYPHQSTNNMGNLLSAFLRMSSSVLICHLTVPLCKLNCTKAENGCLQNCNNGKMHSDMVKIGLQSEAKIVCKECRLNPKYFHGLSIRLNLIFMLDWYIPGLDPVEFL